jgi:NNP family nitrate/nitrite transporter-like MFS transporter
MSLKSFMKAGDPPTLFSAFLYFDLSFMTWVLLAPLAVLIGKDLHLDPAHKGLMVATPVLAGAFLRVVVGVLVDYVKPRTAGLICQAIVIAGLVAAWVLGVHNFGETLLLGCVLGMAGASFAVALPLASRWYPPEQQGLALGIAGAGNSGTVLASLFAPALAVKFGWINVIGMATLPLSVALLVYIFLAKDGPVQPAPKTWAQYFNVLRVPQAWLYMGLYSVTFGGFVGLTSSLPTFFHAEYGLSPVIAGFATSACVFAGSMVRPVGGAVADRFGGVKTLTAVFMVAAAALALVSLAPGAVAIAMTLLIAGMLALGMGNGAVFQLVPQRFGDEMGVMTGLVGMTGGVGGFYLASSLGFSKQLTGSYQAGLLIFAALALLALAVLTLASRRRSAAVAVGAEA